METNTAGQGYPMPNILLLPTLNCQASCSYCFGPHMRSSVMTEEVVLLTAKWIGRLAEQAHFPSSAPKVNIIFHGGEPLLAGHAFFERALPVFKENIGAQVSFSMLSNLWGLDARYVEILKQYHAAVAVSLDGPEDINDRQRGAGYFKKAMAGLQLLREAGVTVSAICTFTPLSAPRAEEVFDFFLAHKLDFQVKTVVEPFDANGRHVGTLSREEHLKLMEKLLQRFLQHAGQLRVKSLERLVRSIVTRENAMYIAGDCLGKQLAVDPQGGIYNCQRFAGMEKYQWNSVARQPSMEQLMSTHGYCLYSRRMARVGQECAGCAYFDICAGGCAYNAFVNQEKKGSESFKDPECEAYRAILDHIVELVGDLMTQDPEAKPDIHSRRKVLRRLLQGIPLPY